MKSTINNGLALAVAIAVAVAPLAIRTAYADQKDDARLHYKQGAALFSAGNYRPAIAEFAKANALAPSAVLEFNIGLCHDRLGERDEAIRRYKNYLVQQPNASNAGIVRDKIQRLEDEIAAEKAATAKPAPPPPAPAPPPPAAPTPEPGPPVVDPAPDPGSAELAPAPTPDEPVYDTGDPELDRVGNMSLVAIRDQYRHEYGATGRARAGAPAGAPAPDQGAVQAPPNHGGAEPPPVGGSAPPPPSAAPPPLDSGKKKDQPVYRKWWFWAVIVGVSAVILINVAASDSGNNNAVMENLPGSPSSDRGASPVLLRF